MDELITGTAHDPHATARRAPAGRPHRHPHAAPRRHERRRRRGRQPASDAARVHDEGIFEATVPGEVLDYRLEVDGRVVDDPYRHPPTLGELDLHLIGEGRHERLWTVLGAQPRDGGVAFAVWAPSAQGVRVVGDFTGWGPHDGWPMRSLGSSGVWEVFVPDASVGPALQVPHPRPRRRLAGEGRPAGQRTPRCRRAPRRWSTGPTTSGRTATGSPGAPRPQPHREPMSVYEVHLGSWRPGLSYRELADQLTDVRRRAGLHPRRVPAGDGAPVRRLVGLPGDRLLRADRAVRRPGRLPLPRRPAAPGRHRRDPRLGAGALPDATSGRWPASTAPRSTSTPTRGAASTPTGARTSSTSAGREVRNFLVANALYWCDGVPRGRSAGRRGRLDALPGLLARGRASGSPTSTAAGRTWTRSRSCRRLNATVYKHHPGVVMVAEESTAWPGRDPADRRRRARASASSGTWAGCTTPCSTCRKEPIHRQYHHNQMTFSTVYAWSENFVLPISHDEVVHGKGSLVAKMPGDMWQRLANLRALLAFMWALPGQAAALHGLRAGRRPGVERGARARLVAAGRPGARRRAAAGRATSTRPTGRAPALWSQDTTPAGFRWIVGDDAANNTLRVRPARPPTARRWCAWSTSPRVPHEDYRIGLPRAGSWTEVINTDAGDYGGSGVGNLGRRARRGRALARACRPRRALRIPPLGAIWLRPN